MDFLHYRYKNWKPGEYIKSKIGCKKIARVYMQKELEDRQKLYEEILKMFGGG